MAKVPAPKVKFASKLPNAVKAVKPLVATKMAKMSTPKGQKEFNPAAGFKMPKTTSPSTNTKGF